jgi:hypothetical protein
VILSRRGGVWETGTGGIRRTVREREGKTSSGNLLNLAVTTVSPLACFPVVLVVLHLVALVGVLVVVQSLLETAPAALAQAVKTQCDEDEDSGGGGSDVDADVSACAEVVPFLGE